MAFGGSYFWDTPWYSNLPKHPPRLSWHPKGRCCWKIVLAKMMSFFQFPQMQFFLTWQGFWTSKRDRLGVPWIQRFWTLALYGHTPRNKNLTSDCLLKSQQFYKIIINNQLSKDFKSKVLKTTFVQVILRKNLIKVQVTPHWWPWFWPF